MDNFDSTRAWSEAAQRSLEWSHARRTRGRPLLARGQRRVTFFLGAFAAVEIAAVLIALKVVSM